MRLRIKNGKEKESDIGPEGNLKRVQGTKAGPAVQQATYVLSGSTTESVCQRPSHPSLACRVGTVTCVEVVHLNIHSTVYLPSLFHFRQHGQKTLFFLYITNLVYTYTV